MLDHKSGERRCPLEVVPPQLAFDCPGCVPQVTFVNISHYEARGRSVDLLDAQQAGVM